MNIHNVIKISINSVRVSRMRIATAQLGADTAFGGFNDSGIVYGKSLERKTVITKRSDDATMS
uniref:Uncharacterized protein n=1 Tax=Peronospora matthiolae TaxID=2874970 RepID=A0AAV1T9J7_9STRA